MFDWLLKKNKGGLPSNYKKLLDPEAVFIVERLQSSGFEAYLVGGCVRDILLSKKPKDFDIATSATPNQIKNIIKRSFIIGRRFRIVVAKRRDLEREKLQTSPALNLFPIFHDRVPEKEFQITTFRREPEKTHDSVDENVFGTAKEDAQRRDFTLNALFLDPSKGSILDFVGGLEDIKKKRLKMIGNPEIRFKEDPIRIFRAIRFAARAGLTLDAPTKHALEKHIPALREAKLERIREEVLKILREGSAPEVIQELTSLKVWKHFSPALAHALENHSESKNVLPKVLSALKKNPWEHSSQAPLFMILLSGLLKNFSQRNEQVFEDKKLLQILDDLKVSRAEREQLMRMRVVLSRICRDSKAEHHSRILGRPTRQGPNLSESFFVLKVLAAGEIDNFPQIWKQWEPKWKEYVHYFQGQRPSRPAYGRSSGSRPPRRRFRPSGPPRPSGS